MTAAGDLEAGLTPEELIPGDLVSLATLATNCRVVADQLVETYRGIQYIELTGADWTGDAAVAYFLLKDFDVTRFKRAADAFEDAESALDDYARCLRDSRDQAAVARANYESGKQRQADDIARCTPPPPPTSPLAPYDPYGLGAAADLLDDARGALERVAASGARALRDAAALSPQRARIMERPWVLADDGPSLSDVLSSPWHLAHGFSKGWVAR